MQLCINPRCPLTDNPDNDNNRFCKGCGSNLLLQGRYRVMRFSRDRNGFGKIYEADERGTPKIQRAPFLLTA